MANSARVPEQIRALNTIRGLAALIVVVSHYSNISQLFDGVLGRGAGQLGVMLFFVLSGFLMAHLYGDERWSGSALRRFAVARCARVVPLFYCVVLASYLATVAGYPQALFRIGSEQMLASHLLFLFGRDILWTIPPEIQFYALFPVLWWLGQRFGRYFLLVVCLLLLALSVAGTLPVPRLTLLGLPAQFWILRTLPLFLFGVLLGRLYGHWALDVRWRGSWGLIALPGLLLLYPEIQNALLNQPLMAWESPLLPTLIALVFFLLVFVVPQGNRVLENRIGDFYGRVSYSLYLTHMPLLKALQPWVEAHPLLGLPLCLALTSALAWCSYRWLELPARSWIRAWGRLSR